MKSKLTGFVTMTLLASGGAFAACSSGDTTTGTTSTSTGSGSGGASTGATSAATTGTGDATTAATTGASSGAGGGAAASAKVFLILMENHNWVDIKGSASAPFINATLLPMGAHAEKYYNPPSLHPSEPNYLWLEAGDNFGVFDDNLPALNHQATTAHLVTQLEAAGHSWKSYQEDITGTECPLKAVGKYAPKHDPMVFFDDVTEKNKLTAARCIAHVRPYAELAADLTADKVPDYSFITPNLCDDMHDICAPLNDSVKQGDTWLSKELPTILNSKAFAAGATVLITWDEGEGNLDGPIGMIVLGKSAKAGYSNTTAYTHSSTLRTVQEIFGLKPFLGDAAKAADLADLFTSLP